jgi:photosystem I subunit 2
LGLTACLFIPLAVPQDGVYPEKVNAGRSGDNTNMRRIGQNTNPSKIKFSGKIPAEF